MSNLAGGGAGILEKVVVAGEVFGKIDAEFWRIYLHQGLAVFSLALPVQLLKVPQQGGGV